MQLTIDNWLKLTGFYSPGLRIKFAMHNEYFWGENHNLYTLMKTREVHAMHNTDESRYTGWL